MNQLHQWLDVFKIGGILPMTNTKDYGMEELWNDRAIHVEPNTGKSHIQLIHEAYDLGVKDGIKFMKDERLQE